MRIESSVWALSLLVDEATVGCDVVIEGVPNREEWPMIRVGKHVIGYGHLGRCLKRRVHC